MILAMLALCTLGLAAGTLLSRRVPLCPESPGPTSLPCATVIVPARNEEQNLPRLLQSIGRVQSAQTEIIVVDDASTDSTAAIAAHHQATVIASASLPNGWTGKTWACAQGAEKAGCGLFLFLDADTSFCPGGLERILSTWRKYEGSPVALSLLPYHVIQAPYEELSLFFNLLMAFGAGGFGAVGKPRLFGQCLLIPRDLYNSCGGHASVRGRILENLAMADRVEAAGGSCICLGGRGVLNLRMFPDGLAQLCASWTKAFADGAAASDSTVLTLAVLWLAALSAIFLLLCFVSGPFRGVAALLYVAAVAQVFWSARQVGGFGWGTALLYPIPLMFFYALFTSSLLSRVVRRKVSWRGRRI